MRIWRSGIFWLAALGLVALVGCKSAEQREADKAEQEKLQGTWAFSSKAEGEKDDEADDVPGDEKKEDQGTTYEIEKDVLTYRFNGEPYRWQRITIDASKDPKQIELLEVDDKGTRITTQSSKRTTKKGKTKTTTTTTEYRQLGVYKLDGDTLTLTLGGLNVKTRPTEVGGKTKGSYTLVLKKKGGKEAKGADKDKGGDKKDEKKDDKKDEKKDDKKDKDEK
jgi:uncharacterized protein (TIGR03067 family)